MARKTMLVALVVLGATASSSSFAGDSDPLQAERWKTRPLVVVAPQADDPLLRQVEEQLSRTAPRAAFDERRMVFYRVVAGEGRREGVPLTSRQTRALLAGLGLRADGPAAVLLVGKDGGTKLVQHDAANLSRIFETVDRMPMRRQER